MTNKNVDDSSKKSETPLKHTKLKADSVTGVNPVRTHGLGCWGNPRVVMGVRVDKELKKRFTDVARRVFGSTCNPIESFMATIVACAETGVNFGNTIEVGKIVIERNLRARRNLEVETGVGDYCTVKGCTGEAVARAVYLPRDEQHRLCEVHLLEARSKPKLWRVMMDKLELGCFTA